MTSYIETEQSAIDRLADPVFELETGECLTMTQILAEGEALDQLPDPVFDIEASMEQLTKLRDDEQRVYMVGRLATDKIMAALYVMWHAAKSASSAEFDALMTNVAAKLTELEIEIRSSSTKSSQFIRYVFANASDKQVHVYSRALDQALKAETASDKFLQYVDSFEKRYEGIRAASTGDGDTKPSTSTRTLGVALSKAENSKSVDTVEVNWTNGDTYRIFVAVLNDDGATAELKDLLLSEDSKKATMLKFYDDEKERTKPSKVTLDEAQKRTLSQAKSDAALAEAVFDDVTYRLSVAVNGRGTPEDIRDLRAETQMAKARMDSAKESHSKLKKSLTAK